MTVAAILKHKGTEVARAAPDDSVAEVVRQLARRRIGAMPVCDAAGRLCGILSERDVVHALAAHGPAALDRPAAALMTAAVQTATRDTTVEEAMELMTHGRFRHLPVVEQGRLVGIVSIGDIVKARMTQQQTEVESLKAYVTGAA